MNIQEQVNIDLKAAMLSKDENTKSILRVLIGEFNRIDKSKFTNEEALKCVKKMVANASDENNNKTPEAKEKNKIELDILLKYVPTQLDVFVLRDKIREMVYHMEQPSMKQMGAVINSLKSDYPGQFDAKLATDIFKEALNEKLSGVI